MLANNAQTDDTPRIYVACLAAYVGGKLHGRWIDADQEPEELQADIDAMVAESPEPGAEEFAIHDFENFAGITIYEYESLEDVSKLAALVVEHGELAGGVYDHASDLDEARAMLEENYQGEFISLADWAEQLLDDTGDLNGLPENLRMYFDYEAFARDAELSGDVFTVQTSDGQVHVFWTR